MPTPSGDVAEAVMAWAQAQLRSGRYPNLEPLAERAGARCVGRAGEPAHRRSPLRARPAGAPGWRRDQDGAAGGGLLVIDCIHPVGGWFNFDRYLTARTAARWRSDDGSVPLPPAQVSAPYRPLDRYSDICGIRALTSGRADKVGSPPRARSSFGGRRFPSDRGRPGQFGGGPPMHRIHLCPIRSARGIRGFVPPRGCCASPNEGSNRVHQHSISGETTGYCAWLDIQPLHVVVWWYCIPDSP